VKLTPSMQRALIGLSRGVRSCDLHYGSLMALQRRGLANFYAGVGWKVTITGVQIARSYCVRVAS
jgi:hypothetical protein